MIAEKGPPETSPVAAASRYDVVILGGGLAGLTLAIQLKRQRPQTGVLVLEKRKGLAPLGAFKVGESTVPAAAHYFAEVLGLREHLQTEQLVKCGLRYFLPSEGGSKKLVQRYEFGPDRYPFHDNYQIDRGHFENALVTRAEELGAEVRLGAHVEDLRLDRRGHVVVYKAGEESHTVSATWLADASGRAGLIKKRLGLGKEVGHKCNAAWFRLQGGLDLEDFGRHDRAWMRKMSRPGIRQFSTNHLMDDGYWLWLIPLSSGHISIGVCADPRLHPFDEINRLERFLEWIRVHEPEVFEAVDKRRDQIDDFLCRKDFAYGVKWCYSTERWCLVGEAAAFTDAFYSPGSDFIGYGNLASGDLISRDLDGHEINRRVDIYNDFYQRMFAYVLSKYEDLYPVFGNTWVMSHKLFWDVILNHYAYVTLMVRNKLTDLAFMKSAADDVDRLFRLSIRMQELFRQWNGLERRLYPNPLMVGAAVNSIVDATYGVVKPLSDEAVAEEIRREVRNAEAWAITIFAQAVAALPQQPAAGRRLNPYGVSLHPEQWEADGLYDGTGLTIEEARRRALAIAVPKPLLAMALMRKVLANRAEAVGRFLKLSRGSGRPVNTPSTRRRLGVTADAADAAAG